MQIVTKQKRNSPEKYPGLIKKKTERTCCWRCSCVFFSLSFPLVKKDVFWKIPLNTWHSKWKQCCSGVEKKRKGVCFYWAFQWFFFFFTLWMPRHLLNVMCTFSPSMLKYEVNQTHRTVGSVFCLCLELQWTRSRNKTYVGQTECSSAQRLQILWRVSGARRLVETGTDASLDVALTINSPSPKPVLALFMRAGEEAPESSDFF